MDILLDLIKFNKTTNFNQKKKLILRPHVYISYNTYDSYDTHLYIKQFMSNYDMSFWYKTCIWYNMFYMIYVSCIIQY